ncbi:MAG: hypothetical protein H7A47_14790 [Verrucomicrobiales bacterium]|nr:hypothetical protein [Verrucomicrobiales bacterium]
MLNERFRAFPSRQPVATATAGFEAGLDSAVANVGGWSEASVSIELVEVTRRRRMTQPSQHPTSNPDESFALLFRGPAVPGRVLTGMIHRLEHPALGELVVFLSPVAIPDGEPATPGSRDLHYEAVFA